MRVVLDSIFEEGIGFGLNRAFKHTDTPSREDIAYAVYNELWNAWDKWMTEDNNQM
jgi:hypothetical protein